MTKFLASTSSRGLSGKPPLANPLGAFVFDSRHIDAKEGGDPLGFGAALVAFVLLGALGEHGGEHQAKQGGRPHDAAAALDEEFEVASGEFDSLVASVGMQLLKHDLSPVLDPLMEADVIETLSKADAHRVAEAQNAQGLQLSKGPGNLGCWDAREKPADVGELEGIGGVVIRLAGFELAAPKFDLVDGEIDLEGERTDGFFLPGGPDDAALHGQKGAGPALDILYVWRV